MSYRIDPRQPLTAEIQRIATEEIGQAMEALVGARTAPEEALHDCRQRFKKLRALFRLVRSADEEFFNRENLRYRDLGRKLAGVREATALIETVDRLAEPRPGHAAHAALADMRAALVARRAQLSALPVKLEADIEAALAECERGRKALQALDLPRAPQDAADLLAHGTGRALLRAQRALKTADRDGTPENCHALRKCVKAHWLQLLLLGSMWPRPRKRRSRAADRLSRRLGELNDLFVLCQRIDEDADRANGNGVRGPGDDVAGSENPDRGYTALGEGEDLALVRRLVEREAKSLKKKCLRKAARLLEDGGRKAVLRELAETYRASAHQKVIGVGRVT
jgi:CHAD domain-containing protein